jgi:hypothetical protein
MNRKALVAARKTIVALLLGVCVVALPGVAVADSVSIKWAAQYQWVARAVLDLPDPHVHRAHEPQPYQQHGTYTRLGLRDTAGNQFTRTSQWNAPGSQNFVLPSGSTTIGVGKQFAYNGRMGACRFCDNVWGGTLNY